MASACGSRRGVFGISGDRSLARAYEHSMFSVASGWEAVPWCEQKSIHLCRAIKPAA